MLTGWQKMWFNKVHKKTIIYRTYDVEPVQYSTYMPIEKSKSKRQMVSFFQCCWTRAETFTAGAKLFLQLRLLYFLDKKKQEHKKTALRTVFTRMAIFLKTVLLLQLKPRGRVLKILAPQHWFFATLKLFLTPQIVYVKRNRQMCTLSYHCIQLWYNIVWRYTWEKALAEAYR